MLNRRTNVALVANGRQICQVKIKYIIMGINYFEHIIELKCKNCGYETDNIALRAWNFRYNLDINDFPEKEYICPNCGKKWI